MNGYRVELARLLRRHTAKYSRALKLEHHGEAARELLIMQRPMQQLGGT